MNKPVLVKKNSGSGLIEVMLSIAILSIGMASMARLHTAVVKEGVANSSRALAYHIASAKLEDLRSFSYRDQNDVAEAGASLTCGVDVFCFSDIQDNQGGQLSSGAVTGQSEYTLGWTVVDSVTAGSPAKDVSISVTWADITGNAGAVTLSAVLFPNDNLASNYSYSGSTGEPGGGALAPKVSYTPIGVPDVVPIEIGNGLRAETSRPLPDVSSKGISVRSAFESVRYDADNKLTSKEEFVTVSCTCEFGSVGEAFPASYWVSENGNLKVKYPKGSIDGLIGQSEETVSKIRGTVPSITGDKQDDLCVECCRDHHDSQGPNASSVTTALYDPDRPSADYQSSGNHKHYYFSSAGDPSLGLVAVSEIAGNRYLESCRFLRVDGFYRLMQDWRLIESVTMKKDGYLVEGSTALEKYQDFVVAVVEGQVKKDKGDSATWDKSSLESRDVANAATGISQYMNRGIYVDRVYGVKSPRVLDVEYYTDLVDKIGDGENVLGKISFNEVNLTLLSSWSSEYDSIASVTNETIKDILATDANYYGTYSRGRVNVLGPEGTTEVKAHALPSNSGLTGGATREVYANTVDYAADLTPSNVPITYDSEIGIDRDDHRTGGRIEDGVQITRSAVATPFTVEGVVKQGNSSGDLTKISVTASGNPCTVRSPVGGEISYSCSVTAGFTGTVSIATSQANGFIRANEDGTSSGSTCSVTSLATTYFCSDFWAFGPTIRVSGNCSGNSCSEKKVTLSSSSSGVNCVNDGATRYCTVPLNSASKTWMGSISVNSSDKKVQVDIVAPTVTPNCIYSSQVYNLGAAVGPQDASSVFNFCANQ